MNKKVIYTGVLAIGLIAFYWFLFGSGQKLIGYSIPDHLIPGIRERRRWKGAPAAQSEWDAIAGVISNRLRELHTGNKPPQIDPDWLKSQIPVPALVEARRDIQAYYDQVIGKVLGWLKGADLEATGGNVWLYAEQIADYLNSSQATSFEAVAVGQYLPEPISNPSNQ